VNDPSTKSAFWVEHLANGKWKLVFRDECKFVHALEMAPPSREAELDVGSWLIVAFAIWSGPARASVQIALDFAKASGGSFQLGVRPFDDHEELLTWWPSDSRRACMASIVKDNLEPVWLLLREGNTSYQGTGAKSAEQLKRLMLAN
jgi:hypothetical protein